MWLTRTTVSGALPSSLGLSTRLPLSSMRESNPRAMRHRVTWGAVITHSGARPMERGYLYSRRLFPHPGCSPWVVWARDLRSHGDLRSTLVRIPRPVSCTALCSIKFSFIAPKSVRTSAGALGRNRTCLEPLGRFVTVTLFLAAVLPLFPSRRNATYAATSVVSSTRTRILVGRAPSRTRPFTKTSSSFRLFR